MSVDTELQSNTVPYVALGEKPKKCRRRRCGICICTLIFALILLAILILPSIIVGHRAQHAKVQIGHGTLIIRSQQYEVINPNAHVFAERSLLQFLSVPYRAHLQPFKAMVYLHLPSDVSLKNSRRLSRWPWTSRKHSPKVMKLGEMAIPHVVLDSSESFNKTVGGNFTITAPVDELAFVAKEFLDKTSVNSTVTATASMLSMLWGIIPLYLPIVHMEYELSVPALHNFQDQVISVSNPLSCEGHPGHVEVAAAAGFYFPAPIAVQLETPLALRVAFPFQGQDHVIGFVKFSHLKIEPGMNNLTGNLSMIQTSTNADALEELFSLYVADQDEEKIDPRIFVTIRDAGNGTSSSELLRKAFQLISVRVGFFPPKEDFLEQVSSDMTFVGSLFAPHPHFYRVTMHMKIRSTLPQQATFTGMQVKAYRDHLNGEKMYDVTRKLDPEDFRVPALAQHYFLSLQLKFNEVHVGMSFQDFLFLSRTGATRHASIGFEARVEVAIAPGGFKQRFRYRRQQVGVMLCYHMFPTSVLCGEHKGADARFAQNSSEVLVTEHPMSNLSNEGWPPRGLLL